ncbi:MAG: DUF1831 domain-containing protein [Lactobacillaceae bacterium]|jgi:hypothetical protein|nr:DUF1831 domain-containing protein [Lactobacillaceae bacterium]
MGFSKTNEIEHDAVYELSPSIKLFTLRDVGFQKNINSSTWNYVGMVEPQKGIDNSIKLKVVINEDMSAFDMSVVNANGSVRVDINDFDDVMKEQYDFIIRFLIEREVLQKSK